MNIKNNKGFSLIEILVTVGLIGILVSIAVPSYNKYRQSTVKMAVKADVGAGQKAYGAKYAVDSSYCHPFSDVGLSIDRKGNPLYNNKGFYGFGLGSTNSGDECGVSISDVQFISKGTGKCSDTQYTTESTCTTATKDWTTKGDTAGSNAAGCILGTNTFIFGGYTDVSNLGMMIQGNHEGKIFESGAINCDATLF